MQIQDFTTLVGINDSGKSTIFEALDIFFGNSRIDSFDRNINHQDEDVQLIGVFDQLPKTLTIEDVPTSLQEEYLLNTEGNLEIKQVFSGATMKMSEYIVANFPSSPAVQGIHTLKIKDLRKSFKDSLANIDSRVSSQIRKSVLAQAASTSELKLIDIALNGTGEMKDISKKIHEELPVFQLFKADRDNSDSDSEVQDPIKAIVKSTIADSADIRQELSNVVEKVQDAVQKTTGRTLTMLREMDNGLASELQADFASPKWESLFKFSLETDSGIPLAKRGSGVRRLILLNFFRAEARKRIEEAQDVGGHTMDVIYAFEEPETSQHPSYQQMLIESFLDMTSNPHVQVLITTHSPAIAEIVPINGLHLVEKVGSREPQLLDGKEALDGVVSELGLIADVKLYDDQIWCAVMVEGPDDVLFFENIYNQLSSASNKHKVIFISGGGTAVVDSLNARFLNQLKLKKRIMIVDGDKEGCNYVKKLDKASPDTNVIPIQLKKATIEFYIPFLTVQNTLQQSTQLSFTTSTSDWDSGEEIFKLSSKQKACLKRANIYGSVNANDLKPELRDELQTIIDTIDSCDA
ncbi:MAG: ATP-binding protein [Lacticaseibacillus songhuajiangensis]|jgi:predicted ATP-dependent endonuclease of OLD family|nr:ATP-binding protein [Lacticaseibacillus songhuajiangensis]